MGPKLSESRAHWSDVASYRPMADDLERLTKALADRYAIQRELGRGGMATVYLARDLKHDRDVAVKVLRPDLAASLGAERFLREIKVAAQLHHPHVLPLYDSGEADGFLYYVMSYEEGQSLREKLAKEGALPVSEAVRLLRDVVDALAHAHKHGVVHRDIKPDNVLLSERHALVTDFGVAKAVSEATGRQQLTTAGVALGTPAYMSPEQAAADPQIDHRADIYAVGALAYELLTGRPPFVGTTAQEVLAAHVTQAPDVVTKHREAVPPALAQVVMRCLEKKPADRWQSAEELLPHLEALTTPSGGITPTDTMPVAVPPMGKHKTALAGLAALGLVVIAGAVLLLPDRGPGALRIGLTTQLTREPGLEIDPAISPDGNMVAYAAGPQAQMRLYVRQVAGERIIPLTENFPGHHRWPQWSPDGTQIAFQSGGSIYLMPALGGSPRRLVSGSPDPGASSPAWSADGQEIAYVSGSAIYVVSVDGGEPREVTDAFKPHSLRWSPDGSRIAYVSGNAEFIFGIADFANIAPSVLWVVSVTGGDPVQVTENAYLNVSPIWTPDSRHLLFVSDEGGSRDVYQVPLDGTGRPSSPPVRLTTGLDAHTINLSADGQHLTYSVFRYDTNIWSIGIPEAGSVSTAEAEALTTGNQVIEDVAVSPDRRWLAFDSDRSGNQDIYRLLRSGGEPERLTSHPSDDFLHQWSPDGSQIAFHSFRTGNRDVYVISADGESLQQVTNDPAHDRESDWSLDGRRLVFRSDRTGPYELYVVAKEDVASGWGTPWRLTFDSVGVAAVRWSPDDRLIAYIAANEVRVIPPGGGDVRVLVRSRDLPGSSVLSFLGWSEDSRSLYLKAFDAEGRSSFWSVPTAGGTPKLLVRFDDPRRQSWRREFATDGERFFFLVDRRESDIWVMELLEP